MTTTFVVCLNYQRFGEFCHQEALNPKSRLLKVISSTYDVYKMRGHRDFDLIFLNDWNHMRDAEIVYTEVMHMYLCPGSKGQIYYLYT